MADRGTRLKPLDLQIQIERSFGILPRSERRRGAQQPELSWQLQRIENEHAIRDRYCFALHLHRTNNLDVATLALNTQRSYLTGSKRAIRITWFFFESNQQCVGSHHRLVQRYDQGVTISTRVLNILAINHLVFQVFGKSNPQFRNGCSCDEVIDQCTSIDRFLTQGIEVEHITLNAAIEQFNFHRC